MGLDPRPVTRDPPLTTTVSCLLQKLQDVNIHYSLAFSFIVLKNLTYFPSAYFQIIYKYSFPVQSSVTAVCVCNLLILKKKKKWAFAREIMTLVKMIPCCSVYQAEGNSSSVHRCQLLYSVNLVVCYGGSVTSNLPLLFGTLLNLTTA